VTISANRVHRRNWVWNLVSTKTLRRERERERERKTQKVWKFEQRRAPQFILQYSANKHKKMFDTKSGKKIAW